MISLKKINKQTVKAIPYVQKRKVEKQAQYLRSSKNVQIKIQLS